MSVSLSHARHWIQRRVSALGENVQKNHFAGKIQNSPWILSLGLALLALLLGYWAQQNSLERADKRWALEKRPKPSVVESGVRNFGLSPVKNPEDIQRLLKSIPDHGGVPGEFWLSSDHAYLAYFSEAHANPKVYGTGPATTAKPSWKPGGAGWVGFEDLLHLLEEKPPLKRLPVTDTDPRALLY